MRLTINNLKVQNIEGIKQQAGEVILFGQLYGLHQNKSFLSPEKAWGEILKACPNEKQLKALLQETIGEFVLCLKKPNEVVFFTSPAGPGFFFTQKEGSIHIFSDEKEFFTFMKHQEVNQFEILRTVLFHQQFRNPFGSIFKEGKRIGGGCYLKIKHNLNIEKGTYLGNFCSETRSFGELSGEFKNILEGVTESIFNQRKRDNNYVLTSGGIDSVVVLLACLQKGLPVSALHWRQAPVLTQAVKFLCQRAKADFKIFGTYFEDNHEKRWWNPYLRNSKEYFRSGLGVIGIDNMFLEDPFTKEKAFFLAGHTFGLLSQCKPFMFADFTRSPFKHIIKDTLQKKPKRFAYSERFWEMKGAFNPLLAKLVGKNYNFPKNDFEYLLGSALNFQVPLMPKQILPKDLQSIEGDYKSYVAKSFLGPILGEDLFSILQKGYSLSAKELSGYLRLLFFTSPVQGVALNNANYQKAGGFALIDPPLQGPLIKFLHTLPITLREVIYPKGLQPQYFKQVLEWDYYKGFLKDFTQASFFMESLDKLRKTFIKEKQKENEISDREGMIRSKYFKEHFLKEIDPNNSAVLGLLKDPVLKDYFYNLYQQIQKGENTKFILINQILNLELFLKSL